MSSSTSTAAVHEIRREFEEWFDARGRRHPVSDVDRAKHHTLLHAR